jgi:Domain of unknown function (DUF4350)
MTDFKKLFNRYWQLGLIALVAIVLLTIISALGGDGRQVGSSYSIAANGYNAWYQQVLDQGIKIKRWQKSFDHLTVVPAYQTRTTLLQVQPKLEKFAITDQQQQWVRQGNTLIILGVDAPATATNFRTDLASTHGQIRIETTRRFSPNVTTKELEQNVLREVLLSDRSGSVITQFNLDQGRIMIATTPYIAANSYQDFRPNYQLLTKLATEDRQQILVDEYIHGYIDRDRQPIIDPQTGELKPDDQNSSGDAFAYLAGTPLIVVLINLALGLLVLIWQQNRRFGKVVIPKLLEIDNGEAYIQALGGVLRQANSSEFVLQQIGKAEQLSWQQKLGLGKERLVAPQVLITAWEAQTQLPATDLQFVLQLTTGGQRISAKELTLWLAKVSEIDRQLGIRL